MASSFERTSVTAYPPISSLLSANGPSITLIDPLASDTIAPWALEPRPACSMSVPFSAPSCAKAAIASHRAGGGGPHGMDSSDLIIVMKRMVCLLLAVAALGGRHHPHVDRPTAFSTAGQKSFPDEFLAVYVSRTPRFGRRAGDRTAPHE